MYTEKIDCAVIGAGVVGLAIARALALQGYEVMVLETAGLIGSETSSRNSEVIHAGIYYTPGSNKANFCVAGKKALYRYVEERGVDYKNCGKLLVANSPVQLENLATIIQNAAANGVDDLVTLTSADVFALEPAVACKAALFSPSTGIIDTHGFMVALQGDLEAAGGMVVLNATVKSAHISDDTTDLIVEAEGETMCLKAGTVVNSAGLFAPRIARSMDGFPQHLVPQEYYARGNYFSLTVKSPFTHLIYPVPEDGAGLGTHLTLDLAGQARFGPDVEWIDEIDYDVDPERAALFYPAIRRYWPELEDNTLIPAYSGIRPKIQPREKGAADFLIQGPKEHGVSGLVQLFGIESPGITSSLAIGDYVSSLLPR